MAGWQAAAKKAQGLSWGQQQGKVLQGSSSLLCSGSDGRQPMDTLEATINQAEHCRFIAGALQALGTSKGLLVMAWQMSAADGRHLEAGRCNCDCRQ